MAILNPAITAITAVPIIGNPAGKNGVVAIAKVAAVSANNLSDEFFSRGHTRPRKAAGTAASNPQAEGSPMAFAPSAPASVKRFQKINTPKPVSQILLALHVPRALLEKD